MGIERLPGAKKRLKASRSDKNKPFAVRLTPYGSKTHTRIGTMNPECGGISFTDSPNGMIYVEYNELLNRQQLGDGTSLVRVLDVDVESLHQMMLQEISAHPRIAARKGKTAKVNAEAKRLQREVSELRKQNQKMQRQINNEAGTLIELQLTGIVPLGEKPPIPLKHLQQMKYGCDWLSMAFKGDILHLFFIESNLSRNGRTPTLTKTEKRFQKAIKQGDLITHYIHHWLDNEGTVHWEI
jgi:hypothetical protein